MWRPGNLYFAIANALTYLLSLVGLVQQYPVRKRGAVFITGTSSGIGRDAALALARSGYVAFAGVRSGADAAALQAAWDAETRQRRAGGGGKNSGSNKNGGAAAEGRVEPVLVDVCDSVAVAAAAHRVAAHCAASGLPLAALVNNAGITGDGFVPLELAADAGEKATFDVNVLGAMRTTRAFLPLIRRSRGRIIFISSAIALEPIPGGECDQGGVADDVAQARGAGGDGV
ncbi:hypothetical protein HK405_014126 [Cladochytrium tenue]|nr:hypothetical protein HK405_014126 [Cladochytrium tenue]